MYDEKRLVEKSISRRLLGLVEEDVIAFRDLYFFARNKLKSREISKGSRVSLIARGLISPEGTISVRVRQAVLLTTKENKNGDLEFDSRLCKF